MAQRLRDELVTGRLMEHGTANYRFQADQQPSYYVSLQTIQGARVLWGKDLQRAIGESASQVMVGDMVGVRRVGQERVDPFVSQHEVNDAAPLYRSRWIVEKLSFLVERAQAARRLRDDRLEAQALARERPGLKQELRVEHAARTLALRHLHDERDRQRFVMLVRQALEGMHSRGGALLPLSNENGQGVGDEAAGVQARLRSQRMERGR